MSIQAYPLTWPLTYPRAKSRQPSRFLKLVRSSVPGARLGGRRHSIDEARSKLFDELQSLGAKEVVLSSNLALRLDGFPNGGQGNPVDPGVAVYFKLRERSIVLPCDKWQHVQCNLWAIACHIESLRGQERWGVGTVDQAFTGYLALEQQTQPKWHEVLGVSPTASKETLEAARREKLKIYHPDGSAPDADKYHEVGEAYRIALLNRPQS